MKLAILALALAVAPISAIAQNYDMAQMQQGLTMLETNAQHALMSLGIESDPQQLTIAQLAAIHLTMSGSEDESQKKSRVEAIIAQ